MYSGRITACDRHFAKLSGRKGCVDSVYAHAFNFTVHGELFAVVERGDLRAPFSAVISLPSIESTGIQPGQPVFFDGDALCIGDSLWLDCSSPAIYDARFGNRSFCREAAKRHLEEFEAYLMEETPLLGGVSFYLTCCAEKGGHHTAESNVVQTYLNDRLWGLIAAVLDGEDVPEHLRKVLGLGWGLTPSADDFLCGLLEALDLGSDTSLIGAEMGERQYLASAQKLRGCLASWNLRSYTTAVSAQMLKAAAAREGPLLYAALLDAFLGKAGNLRDVLKRVRTVGHTSGMDHAAGMAAGLQILLSELQVEKFIFLKELTPTPQYDILNTV